jgi:pyruvate,water dikinase
MTKTIEFVKPLDRVNMTDIASVGGKNASLGEMIQNLKGCNIPGGFAITSDAYRYFMEYNHLTEKIDTLLKQIQVNQRTKEKENLEQVGEEIRSSIVNSSFPKELQDMILDSYHEMEKKYGQTNLDVAVRSSATAEDLPDASFAGQQETFLNICGTKQLLTAILHTYASLFTNRAISYRIDKNFDHMQVALSVGVQKMVRSDLACSGVMFTLDTESGFEDAIFITSSYGLGECIVQGNVNPDEYYVHKPTLKQGFKPLLKKRLGTKERKMIYNQDTNRNNRKHCTCTVTVETSEKERFQYSLTDEEVLELAKQAVLIEEHYSKIKGSKCPMDIEWAKCGLDGKLYIVQARPETVQSNTKKSNVLETYSLDSKGAKLLLTGKSIGSRISSGIACVCKDIEDMKKNMTKGMVLVTDSTDPDMEPYMCTAAAIVTQKGGRTCHAAIICRELGIPAIVGADNAMKIIKTNMPITVDCHNGEIGRVFEGELLFSVKRQEINIKENRSFSAMINIANPDEAFATSRIPNDGVGLARMEFIINNTIQVHPMALVHPEKIEDKNDLDIVNRLLQCNGDKYINNKKQFFIDKLAQEAGTIAAAFYPKPVIIRMSDFKSSEYGSLLCGKYFEPDESNAMIGFRGASRYYHEMYREAFVLECLAMKKIRDEYGLTNTKLMVPFVRTVDEARKVVQIMNNCGLIQGENGLELYMMVEIPSNVILIDQFAKIFDGFSIGSNDLTQTTLAVDRDSSLVAPLFDERNEAVLKMLEMAIRGAKRNGRKIGICGQGPSDYPELAEFLIRRGIDSLSLNSDTVLPTLLKYQDLKPEHPPTERLEKKEII